MQISLTFPKYKTSPPSLSHSLHVQCSLNFPALTNQTTLVYNVKNYCRRSKIASPYNLKLITKLFNDVLWRVAVVVALSKAMVYRQIVMKFGKLLER